MQAFFEIWIETHSSKAHQSFWPVLNRETLTAINISSRLDISWDGELHLFTSSLITAGIGKPQHMYRHVNPIAIPQHPSWSNVIVIVHSVFAPCLLAWLCMSLNLHELPQSAMKHGSAGPLDVSPISCLKQVYRQCQSRSAGSAAVPLTRKFQRKKPQQYSNYNPAWIVTTPGTTWVFTVVRNCLLWRIQWGMKVFSYTEVTIASLSLKTWIFANCKNDQIPSFEVGRKANYIL